jgi:hypothetical protein
MLGGTRPLDGGGETQPFHLSANDLTTHGVVLGMTGSGKTGLLLVMVEEALRQAVPVILVDVKGDLANLMLTFPNLAAEEFAPWVQAAAGQDAGEAARAVSDEWRQYLAAWGLGAQDVAALAAKTAMRLITPGTTAGEPLHLLSALENPSPLWATDVEAAREALGASITLLLRLVGRDADPVRSRDHVVLSLLAERRLSQGRGTTVAELLADVVTPPMERIGAMEVDEFLPPKERAALATALNTLLASPTFDSWRQGSPLDVGAWLAPREDGRTPAVILSVAHLDDDERQLVLGVVLEEVLAWVRSLPGSTNLRALLVFDEVYGFVPPHPKSPPTKRPIVSLMKQARAFGVGMLLGTQNPMDLDYRALSNAGLWCVGRLQTDADRARVVDALSTAGGLDGMEPGALADTLKQLAKRWFVVHDVHRRPAMALLQSRTAMSWLRGPMTRGDLRRLMAARSGR